MIQAEFERRAAEILDSLFEQIEEQVGDWLDVEMNGGILQIELPDGGTYVVAGELAAASGRAVRLEL
jgi:frataxin-like iron-binding protein CyaY